MCSLWFAIGCLFLTSNAFGVTYLTQEQALALAFEKPDSAERHPLIFDSKHRGLIEKKLGEPIRQRGVLSFIGVLKSDHEMGVVILDAVIGKHEWIDYMVVLNSNGKVKFVEILAYRESYGGEVREKNWRDQFIGKSQKDSPEHEKNIVNISGATLSCRHVTEGVKKILAIANVYASEFGIHMEE